MSTHTSERSLLNAERRQHSDMIKGSNALRIAIHQRHPRIVSALRNNRLQPRNACANRGFSATKELPT